jgi:hypothetical protein
VKPEDRARQGAARGFVRDLRVVWQHSYYRRLLATNLTSRLGDGFLLAAAGTYVLFDPREAATLSDFALASIALYLPYSLIGPFAGIVLDRWPRRQVLFVASLLRALSATVLAVLVAVGAPLPVFAVVLLATVGLNRFFIAGVGASIPRVVPVDELVMANAVTPTLVMHSEGDLRVPLEQGEQVYVALKKKGRGGRVGALSRRVARPFAGRAHRPARRASESHSALVRPLSQVTSET